MKRLLLVVAWLIASPAVASPKILVVDLSEAYTRSSALSGLLQAVDQQLKTLAQKHRPELERLHKELRALKQQGGDSRDQQLALARKISDIEAAAEHDEERLTEANQAAIAEVDSAIAAVKAALKAETKAKAVLDIQDTQYVRPDCPCIATERLYALLNERLPKVELKMPAG